MTLIDVVKNNKSLARIKRQIWNTQFLTIPTETTDTLYYTDSYNLDGTLIYSPNITDLLANDWINF